MSSPVSLFHESFQPESAATYWDAAVAALRAGGRAWPARVVVPHALQRAACLQAMARAVAGRGPCRLPPVEVAPAARYDLARRLALLARLEGEDAARVSASADLLVAIEAVVRHPPTADEDPRLLALRELAEGLELAAPASDACWIGAPGMVSPPAACRLVPEAPARQTHLEILRAGTREDEAAAAARWVLDRLGASPGPVLLVSLDEVLMRRFTALLARADVVLAETVPLLHRPAAARLLRGLELGPVEGDWAALSAWLDGVAAREVPAGLREALAQAAGEGTWLRGLRAASLLPGLEPGAAAWLTSLAALREAAETAGDVSAHATLALAWLDRAGGIDPQAACERALRALLASLRTEGVGVACDAAGWRTLLQDLLARERLPASTAARVVRVAPHEAVGTPCSALLVLGGSDDARPPSAAANPFLPSVLRATEEEDGLRTLDIALALVPRSAVSCRESPDEGVTHAPWLDRWLGREDVHLRPAADLARSRSRALQGQPRWGARASLVPDALPARLAVTEVDALLACPYRFWGRSVLGLRERREPADRPARREQGVLVHGLLHAFHEDLHGLPFEAGQARAHLHRLTDRAAVTLLARTGAWLPLIAEWRAVLPAYVDWLATRARAGWSWSRGEWSLEARFPVGDTSLVLRGQLDRVDIRDADGAHALVDYKLGRRAVQARHAAQPEEHGQLPLYALLLEAAGAPPVEAGLLQIERGGVSWFPLRRPAEAAQRFSARLGDVLQRAAAGEPLAALGHEDDCGRCEMRGLCRREHWQPPTAR